MVGLGYNGFSRSSRFTGMLSVKYLGSISVEMSSRQMDEQDHISQDVSSLERYI